MRNYAKSSVPVQSGDYYRSLVDLDFLSPQEFEEYISFLLREMGYKTRRRGAVGQADGGVDIDAWLDGRHILVQCKRYGSSWVHHGHVRDLLGAVVLESADCGYLVSTGRFTPAAGRAARKTPRVKLFGLRGIRQWQKEAGIGPYLPAPELIPNSAAQGDAGGLNSPAPGEVLVPPGAASAKPGSLKKSDDWFIFLLLGMFFVTVLPCILCFFGMILSQTRG